MRIVNINDVYKLLGLNIFVVLFTQLYRANYTVLETVVMMVFVTIVYLISNYISVRKRNTVKKCE